MAEIKLEEKKVSRRTFLKGTGLVVGGALGGGIVGGLITSAFSNKEKTVDTAADTDGAEHAAETHVETVSDYNQALMYFTKEQYEIIEAAAERIFPADENGPGAKDLGVAFYIDHQLASPWGVNAGMYMQGPFLPGEPTQGEQSRMTKRQIYDMAIKAIDEWSQLKYSKKFVELAENQQDEVIAALEKGEINTFKGYSAKAFFNLFRGNVLEGLYSDPVYGGNRDMGGWKLKKYAGGQMSYAAYIDKDEVVELEPVSLKDHLKN